ncbi:MAG: WXG100 family type VII secretion target [Porcipelethomonas sp.]
MAVNGGYKLKVSSDAMYDTHSQLETQISKLESAFSAVQSIVDNTASYWTGDGGNKHRRVFDKYKGDISDAIERLKEHSRDIEEMTGNYNRAEKEAEEQSRSLPFNIIS